MTAQEKLNLVLALNRTKHPELFKKAQKGDKAATAILNKVVDAVNAGDVDGAIALCK